MGLPAILVGLMALCLPETRNTALPEQLEEFATASWYLYCAFMISWLCVLMILPFSSGIVKLGSGQNSYSVRELDNPALHSLLLPCRPVRENQRLGC